MKKETFRVFIKSKSDINNIWRGTSYIGTSKEALTKRIERINSKSDLFEAKIEKI